MTIRIPITAAMFEQAALVNARETCNLDDDLPDAEDAAVTEALDLFDRYSKDGQLFLEVCTSTADLIRVTESEKVEVIACAATT